MEEKYKKFLEYNWENSDEWHSYYINLFPTPPENKIIRYKKKFYRNKIDPDFDIDYKPAFSKEEEQEQKKSQSTNNNTNKTSSSNSSQKNDYSKTPLLNIETILMLLFPFSLPLKYNSKIISIIIFLIRSIRLVGIPKFEMAYLHQLLKNESFQVFIYSIEILIEKFNFFLMVPIIISMTIAFCENIKKYNLNLGTKINQIIDWMNNKKEDILQDKSDIELGMVIFLIVGFMLKINSLIIFIIHIQVLYIKYNFDFRLKRSLNKLNSYVNLFKNSNNCPVICKNIIEKIQNMFEYLGNSQINNK